MKAMEHNMESDKPIAFICGMAGGMIKFISGSIILNASFVLALLEAGATAMVCGFLGVAGKHLFNSIRKKWYDKRKNKKQ